MGSNAPAKKKMNIQQAAHTLSMSFIKSIELEAIKAILTGSIAGFVFVIGQTAQRFIIEPAVEMRKLVAHIAHDLVFYRNCFSSLSMIGDEEWAVATGAYRRHAASLRSLPLTVPFYGWLAPLLRLPSRNRANLAASALIGLSNMSRNPTSDDFTWKNAQFTVAHDSLRIPDHDRALTPLAGS